MLVEVFEGNFDEPDWEHALGGMHALAYDGAGLVGHASVVQRRLIHEGERFGRATSRGSACAARPAATATRAR